MSSIIKIPVGGRALLRIADLDVTEYQTLASMGIPMQVIGLNAKLLRTNRETISTTTPTRSRWRAANHSM